MIEITWLVWRTTGFCYESGMPNSICINLDDITDISYDRLDKKEAKIEITTVINSIEKTREIKTNFESAELIYKELKEKLKITERIESDVKK